MGLGQNEPMGWMEFVAELVRALVWPLVAVLALFMFRRTVDTAMSSITSKASGHIEYRDFRVGWESRLAAAEAEVERIEAVTDPADLPEPAPRVSRSAEEEWMEIFHLSSAMSMDLHRALAHLGLQSNPPWKMEAQALAARNAGIITPEMYGAVTNCSLLFDLLMHQFAMGHTVDDAASYIHELLPPLEKIQGVIASVVSRMMIPASRPSKG